MRFIAYIVPAAVLFGCLITLAQAKTEVTNQDVIHNYAQHVHGAYAESLHRAELMRDALKEFTTAPSLLTQDAAKAAWIHAREIYGQTEVFRFYNGPIDQDGGPEGLLNSWPLDEAYIDYVVGNPTAGIINDLQNYPQITKQLLIELNQFDGEKNVSTGYHAIEFLLWGQDFFDVGAGQRSFEDFLSAANADRRAEYLNIVADLLVEHLAELEYAWRAGVVDNYHAEFVAMPEELALKKILTGIIFMAGDELSGERMYVAYDTRGQEDEHSCFSDMTHMDIQWNYWGVENVINVSRILELAPLQGQAVVTDIQQDMLNIRPMLAALPVPFDQAIVNDPSRAMILTSVEALEKLAVDLSEMSKLINARVDY